ncbi:cobalt-precorrin 5A hydrolase [Clostridium sp. CMCC3677]|uniref:cobalt-precorrin 5A hydrolase n=1 Tax=Clostridium sp. CMCC3677 TaxID=2949963 RepID=UPI0013F0548C|nr:cobalt-precorrin 5A hydrolase [Clostridium sp. CMCC3677]NFG61749.1 cobalt-precorrin 5A hydrolase [Clostridium botulinum]NFQ08534.1 cobalt-precorrin 5A hydrolase [Clostridium botulinum]
MISIICPSPKGKGIAYTLKEELGCNLYIKEESNLDTKKLYNNSEVKLVNNIFKTDRFNLYDVTKDAVGYSDKIIFISSTGIAVRAIAQFIKSKDKDPGVVVVDLANKYTISLLSGHLGGGNELTLEVSKILNNIPIITTATDNLGIVAPDILAKQNNLIIEDLKKAKYISAILVNEKIIGLKDDYEKININKGYKNLNSLEENSIWITNKIIENPDLDYSKILRLIKKDLILGIGCRRDTPSEKLEECVRKHLLLNNLEIKAVKKIVSIDVKKDEKAIIDLSNKLECDFNTFSGDEIRKVQHKFESSNFVLKSVGVTSVCEPCVYLEGAEILINKIKDNGITLCIGINKDEF